MIVTEIETKYRSPFFEEMGFSISAIGYDFSCSLQVDRIRDSLLAQLSKINTGDEIDVEIIFRDKNGNEICIK